MCRLPASTGKQKAGRKQRWPAPRPGGCLNRATLKFHVVPVCVSEAFVLRTYPLKEADLIVSFLTRDQGKLRGVARRARRPKSVFGAGLERLSQVKFSYFQHPARELVNLDSCDLIRSQFSLVSDYTAGVALDYLAEVSEQLLPPAEPNERWFRLLDAVLDYIQPGGTERVWCAVTYFTLWAVRLGGFLPDTGARSWQQLSAPSRGIAEEMLHRPVGGLREIAWSRETAADLRRSLVWRIESQLERRLITAGMLENS